MDLAKITDLNGINRYIMECKLIIMHLEDIAILELIDTLWNVNLYGRNLRRCQWFELIDTLWNVNITLYVDEYCCSGELIDTLWNVNENGYPELVAPPRINRYIMECK